MKFLHLIVFLYLTVEFTIANSTEEIIFWGKNEKVGLKAASWICIQNQKMTFEIVSKNDISIDNVNIAGLGVSYFQYENKLTVTLNDSPVIYLIVIESKIENESNQKNQYFN